VIDVELSGVFLPLEAWVGGVVGELSDESLLQQLVDNASCDEWMFGVSSSSAMEKSFFSSSPARMFS
jgi:hypothetical protein